MKKIIILLGVCLLAQENTQAQGTTYLSGLSPTVTGTASAGSDDWLAAGFGTGSNPDGYTLDSIQLGMANATGSPDDFTVMIYLGSPTAILPGTSIGTLDGSANPSTASDYTYTPASDLTLLPNTTYFIVVTAGTPTASGAYMWEEGTYPPNSSGGWGAGNRLLYSTDDGSMWSILQPYPSIAQYAINAAPVPEPGEFALFTLGALSLGLRRWRKRVSVKS
jgi:hypothetical protein